MKRTEEDRLLLIIRGITIFFIGALIVSGITAMPAETGLKFLCNTIGISTEIAPENYTGLKSFIATAYEALAATNKNYPFLAYGYDWLAFAHFVIGISFIGLLIKPVRNKWIIYYAMIACIGVIPLAFIAGEVRGIPILWRLVDCSFGVFGFIPLYILHKNVKKLEILINYKDQKY